MSSTKSARAVADLDEGLILGSVTIAAPPERVFRALTSDEIVKWWGSDRTYRVTGWTSDLRVGGEYLEIDPPRKLIQTWVYDWGDRHVTKLTYRLQPTSEGTKVTTRHEGFKDQPESCSSHADGWERVLDWLAQYCDTAS
jgi:uncharacterized protein YndB with AHSA1/START domain